MIYDLEQLLPHRAPMILLSGIQSVDFEAHSLTAFVSITPDDVFFDAALNGVPSYVALEYMAQTVGCFVGAYDLSIHAEQKPRVGFVLGSRRIETYLGVFKNGQQYTIRVKEIFYDDNIASFECDIVDSDKQCVAHAVLNAYRPNDIKDFMKGYQ